MSTHIFLTSLILSLTAFYGWTEEPETVENPLQPPFALPLELQCYSYSQQFGEAEPTKGSFDAKLTYTDLGVNSTYTFTYEIEQGDFAEVFIIRSYTEEKVILESHDKAGTCENCIHNASLEYRPGLGLDDMGEEPDYVLSYLILNRNGQLYGHPKILETKVFCK